MMTSSRTCSSHAISAIHWEQIANNLPMGKVNVVREDIKNKNLLFVGHEFGLYISLDGGREWQRFSTGLPTVRIDDILIHPRDNDLILGTHGRSIYILDDISPLQQWDAKVQASDAYLFNVRPGIEYAQDTTLSRSVGPSKNFRGENPQPGTMISYYLKSAPTGDVKITISDINGNVVRNMTGPKMSASIESTGIFRPILPQAVRAVEAAEVGEAAVPEEVVAAEEAVVASVYVCLSSQARIS